MTRRAGRALSAVPLGLALLAAVAWLVFSLTRLIGSVTTYHQRVLQRRPGAAVPTAAEVHRLLANQNHWGVLTMFAVAAVAATLLLTIIAWLLGTQRRPADRG